MITITIQITQDKDGGFSVNLGTPEQPAKRKPKFQQLNNSVAFDTIDDDDGIVPFDED